MGDQGPEVTGMYHVHRLPACAEHHEEHHLGPSGSACTHILQPAASFSLPPSLSGLPHCLTSTGLFTWLKSVRGAGLALCIAITPIWGHQEKEELAQRPVDPSEVAAAWMMLTGHTSGVIQLWGNQECEIVPLARLTSQRSACRCGGSGGR